MSLPAATIRRISKELNDLTKKPVREFCLVPLEGNPNELHFTIVGPEDTPYAGGIYHGRLMIPSDYPSAPPDAILLTPNGQADKRYSPERWETTWGITAVLYSLHDFMRTSGHGEIAPEAWRKESWAYHCPVCGTRVKEQFESLMEKAPPSTDRDRGEISPLIFEALASTPAVPPAPPADGSSATIPLEMPDAAPPPAAAVEKGPDCAAGAVATEPPLATPAAQPAPAQPAPAPAPAPPAPAPAPAAAAAAAVQRRAAPYENLAGLLDRGVEIKISVRLVDRLLRMCIFTIGVIVVKKALFDYRALILVFLTSLS